MFSAPLLSKARLLHNQEGANNVEKGRFKRSRRELSLGVSVDVHILLTVEQSSLESQSRGCAKTPILTTSLALQSHQIVTSLLYIILAISLELYFYTVTECLFPRLEPFDPGQKRFGNRPNGIL